MAEEDSDSSSDDEVQGTVLWTKLGEIEAFVQHCLAGFAGQTPNSKCACIVRELDP